MATDITRFDFRALRWTRSENVRAMNMSERGQYITLMVEAWLGGKDASLPSDREYLSSLVGGERLSPKVLKMFPPVQTQWGERLQNPTLYEEWLLAQERSDNGRRAVEVRWNNERNTGVSESYIPKPNQAVPNQTNPNQHDSGNFKNMAVSYRRAFHVNLSHGSLQKEEFAKACREFSEDVVLAAFDDWAPENMWIKERHHTNGLRQFYESLPATIEADAQIELGERAKATSELELQNILDASVSAGQTAHALEEQKLLEQRKEQEEIAARVAEDPDALFRG